MALTNQYKRQMMLVIGYLFIFWNTILFLTWFFEKPEVKSGVMAVWFVVDGVIILATALYVTALTLFPYEKDDDTGDIY